MRKILLLGGFGFIGTNLIKYIDTFCKDNYCVIVFDKFENHPHEVSFESIIDIYSGDFSDSTLLQRIFKEHKIDIVLHSLSSTIPVSSNNAKYDVMSNLLPTLDLLELMRISNVKDIIYLSSGGAIYGDYLEKVHNENDAVYPKSSYGVVKLAIEKYLLSYAELFGFNSLILRLSNPYGPYHYNTKQGIVNVAVRKALNDEVLQIWGSGQGLKDYIYIGDVCKIIIKMIDMGVKTDVFNLASGRSMSVNEIAFAVKNLIPSFKYEYIAANAVDVQSFELDITKLRNSINNIDFTTFNEGLAKVVEWQKNSI